MVYTPLQIGRPVEQLWAAAVHRVRTNRETAYLPDTLKATQAELTEQFRAVDEVAEDVIGAWLDENPRPATANQIATGIHWTLDSRSRLPHHHRPQAAGLHPGE